MDAERSIDKTRIGFENLFEEANYYNRQTQDERHLALIMDSLCIGTGDKILDLGTGSGYLAFPIAIKHPECTVIGVDIVVKALEKNREKAMKQGLSSITFVSYDGVDLPFMDAAFTVITTRYALHHFPLLENTFRNLSRIIKEGGQLFISDPTPDMNDHVNFIDSFMQTAQDGHVKFYTKDEFVDLASNAGFRLEKSFQTQIRFPRKRTPIILDLLDRYDLVTKERYAIEICEDDVYITTKVWNLLFIKT